MKRIILSCCVTLLSLQGYAQNNLTLDECRKMALENNKQAQISGYSIQKAEQEVKAMKSNYLPKISASGGYMYADKDFSMNLIPSMSANLNLNNTYFAGLQLEEPIYMGGKIVAANKISRTGLEIARLNKQKTEDEIVITVDEAYWGLVKANELISVANKYKEAVEEVYRNVEHLYKTGMVPKNDLLKVQVKLNEADLSIHRSQNAIRQSKMNLCHIIGLPLTSDIYVSGELGTNIIPVAKDEFTAENRLEYQTFSKMIDLKKQEIKLTQSEFLPQIGLVAGYNYLNGIKMNSNKLLSDDIFAVMLAVKIPLFHWGEGRHKIKAARLEQHIVEIQRADLSDKIQLEVSQAINTLDEAILEVRLTETAYRQSEENLRESRKNYSTGMETLVNYLEAQVAWQQAWSESVSAKAACHLAESNYLKAIGKLNK